MKPSMHLTAENIPNPIPFAQVTYLKPSFMDEDDLCGWLSFLTVKECNLRDCHTAPSSQVICHHHILLITVLSMSLLYSRVF